MQNIIQQGQFNHMKWQVKRPEGSSNIHMFIFTIHVDDTTFSITKRVRGSFDSDYITNQVVFYEGKLANLVKGFYNG